MPSAEMYQLATSSKVGTPNCQAPTVVSIEGQDKIFQVSAELQANLAERIVWAKNWWTLFFV